MIMYIVYLLLYFVKKKWIRCEFNGWEEMILSICCPKFLLAQLFTWYFDNTFEKKSPDYMYLF